MLRGQNRTLRDLKSTPKAKNILLEAQNQLPMDETTPRLKSTPSDQIYSDMSIIDYRMSKIDILWLYLKPRGLKSFHRVLN